MGKKRQLISEWNVVSKSTKQIAKGDFDVTIDQVTIPELQGMVNDINHISLYFNGYIKEISRVLSHLSVGDMTVGLAEDIKYRGDFIPIKTALSKIISSMNETFIMIDDLVKEVNDVCKKVEENSIEVANRNVSQMEEMNSLCKQITIMQERTKQTAQKAHSSAKNINQIKQQANQGVGYVSKMLTSMEKVNVASKDIMSIVDLINSLSAQTNILSLNASIEAARAGDAGKGFAVVADEVRNLATQSADAANRTSQLIHDSLDKISESTSYVDLTADTFQQIHRDIDQSVTLVEEMAKASEEQVDELIQTTQMINQISESVENSAAFSQESAASVDCLVSQTSKLADLLTHYKIKGRYVSQTNTDQIDEEAKVIMQQLVNKAINSFKVEDVIQADNMEENIECLYIIDQEGIQLTPTIMNPNVMVDSLTGFSPCPKGFDHSDKKYYTRAIAMEGKLFISHEYISSATGGLCKTYSCTYERGGKTEVLCLDMKCPV